MNQKTYLLFLFIVLLSSFNTSYQMQQLLPTQVNKISDAAELTKDLLNNVLNPGIPVLFDILLLVQFDHNNKFQEGETIVYAAESDFYFRSMPPLSKKIDKNCIGKLVNTDSAHNFKFINLLFNNLLNHPLNDNVRRWASFSAKNTFTLDEIVAIKEEHRWIAGSISEIDHSNKSKKGMIKVHGRRTTFMKFYKIEEIGKFPTNPHYIIPEDVKLEMEEVINLNKQNPSSSKNITITAQKDRAE